MKQVTQNTIVYSFDELDEVAQKEALRQQLKYELERNSLEYFFNSMTEQAKEDLKERCRMVSEFEDCTPKYLKSGKHFSYQDFGQYNINTIYP